MFDVPFVETAAPFSFGLFFRVIMEQRIYHGCFYKNADGTNKIIAASNKCLAPTDKCFWKDTCDVKHGVKRRSRAKNEPRVTLRDFNCYHDEKLVDFWINKWITFPSRDNEAKHIAKTTHDSTNLLTKRTIVPGKVWESKQTKFTARRYNKTNKTN